MSVAILVHELQNEPFNPILFYKPQGSESEKKPFLKKYSFFLALQRFRWNCTKNFPTKFCVLMPLTALMRTGSS